jgi:hypothetical protein
MRPSSKRRRSTTTSPGAAALTSKPQQHTHRSQDRVPARPTTLSPKRPKSTPTKRRKSPEPRPKIGDGVLAPESVDDPVVWTTEQRAKIEDLSKECSIRASEIQVYSPSVSYDRTRSPRRERWCGDGWDSTSTWTHGTRKRRLSGRRSRCARGTNQCCWQRHLRVGPQPVLHAC